MSGVQFNKQKLDILKEVGNICAGNATIALAQILFKRIELQTPIVKILTVEDITKILYKDEHNIIGIQMEALGAINGHVLLLFTEKSAYNLMEILIGYGLKQPKFITQIGISSLKEIGNIVISSYLSTLSSLSRLAVFPSCPQFTEGLPSAVFKSVFGSIGDKEAKLILIETIFTEQATSVNGNFFIAFDSKSMQLILKACEKNLCKEK